MRHVMRAAVAPPAAGRSATPPAVRSVVSPFSSQQLRAFRTQRADAPDTPDTPHISESTHTAETACNCFCRDLAA